MTEAELKSRFLALYAMVLADGVVAAEELEVLYRIGREQYGLTMEQINSFALSVGSSLNVPENDEDFITLLYQMAEIAWADGEIDETEKNILKKYAIRFGYAEENAAKIADYMLEQVKNKVSVEDIINQIKG